MNIGFVSTWFERGGAYVTKSYMSLLQEQHNVYIYARGGYTPKKKTDKSWADDNVTYGYKMNGTSISSKHYFKWIKERKLDIVFYNEQMEMDIVALTKLKFPNVKLGTYVDYYKLRSVQGFELFDFLICNTKRHYSVFKWHPQVFYVPWGTNVDLFNDQNRNEDSMVRFFHSAGMSIRKGTDLLIRTFLEGELWKKAKLIIHTQIPIKMLMPYDVQYLAEHNVQVIEKTVTAPGLYHLGDVYVYPTTLDGLGLTMYEALSCGLPVIATNFPPMNEIITLETGRLIDVEKVIARDDGYYWPLAIVDSQSLQRQMKYYIDNKDVLKGQQEFVRRYALTNLDWNLRREEVLSIFENSKISFTDVDKAKIYVQSEKKHRWGRFYDGIVGVLPGWLQDFCHEKIH